MIVGLGTDIIEIERIKKAILKNDRFLQKNYTKKEIEYCSKKSSYESYAGYFCAKEAFFKAMGTGMQKFDLSGVEVYKNDAGKPYLKFSNEIQIKLKQMNISQVHITISHSDIYAVANCILEGF